MCKNMILISTILSVFLLKYNTTDTYNILQTHTTYYRHILHTKDTYFSLEITYCCSFLISFLTVYELFFSVDSSFFPWFFAGVCLTIPTGCIEEGHTEDMFLAVCRDDKDRPQLTGKIT